MDARRRVGRQHQGTRGRGRGGLDLPVQELGKTEWKSIEQRVPITWTVAISAVNDPCSVYRNGRYCGRRVAVLYGAGELFACRRCYGLAYASQQETPMHRRISQAQQIRMRLRGSAILCEAADDHSNALVAQWLNRRNRSLKRRS